MEPNINPSDTSIDYYTFASGPVKMSVPLEKLSIHFENGLLLVKTSQLYIIDDKSKPCLIYVNGSDSTEVTLNNLLSGEHREHLYTQNDTFSISTTRITDSNKVSIRYHFLATRADFWFEKKNTGKKWMIRLSSSEDTIAGPLLSEDILEPRYFDKEFTIENQLERPVFLTGTDSGPGFYVDWTKTGKRNKLLISNSGVSADYFGWRLRLRQCSLTPGGIIFDSFDIKAPLA